MELQTFDGKQFTWQGQLGITEASTLGWVAEEPVPMTFRVRSHRTGKTLSFLYAGSKFRGDDGTAYVYVAPGGVTLHVYNT